MIRYGVLISLWGAWCFLHSFLISPTVTGLVRKRFENGYRYYRLFYNLTALATLIPVSIYTFSLRGQPVFSWEGPLRIVQGMLGIFAMLFFIGGARRYDLALFLGIRQIRKQTSCAILTDDCHPDTGGILKMVRHPWYAGGILIVWSRNLDVSAILTNLIITLYFIIGAFIEERKLRMEFGEEYIQYQRRVSMLFPLKWIIQHLSEVNKKPNRNPRAN